MDTSTKHAKKERCSRFDDIPVDCIGVIVEFFSSFKDLLTIMKLNKENMRRLNQINLICFRNVLFQSVGSRETLKFFFKSYKEQKADIRKNMKWIGVFKARGLFNREFVNEIMDLKYCNMVNLKQAIFEFFEVKEIIVPDSVEILKFSSCFSIIKGNIKNLKELHIKNCIKELFQSFFTNIYHSDIPFSNLKTLVIRNAGYIFSWENIKELFFLNLETLELYNSKIDGNLFLQCKKMKNITIVNCPKFTNAFFRELVQNGAVLKKVHLGNYSDPHSPEININVDVLEFLTECEDLRIDLGQKKFNHSFLEKLTNIKKINTFSPFVRAKDIICIPKKKLESFYCTTYYDLEKFANSKLDTFGFEKAENLQDFYINGITDDLNLNKNLTNHVNTIIEKNKIRTEKNKAPNK